MAQFCPVCQHERRADIEAALLRQESHADIARRFGTSMSSIVRHRNHLWDLRELTRKPERPNPAMVLARIKVLQETSALRLRRVERSRDLARAVMLLRELEEDLDQLREWIAELKALLRGPL